MRVTVPRFSACKPFTAPSQSLNSRLRNTRSQYLTMSARRAVGMFAIKASCAFAVKQKCNQAQREGASRLLRSREHSKKLPIPKLQAPKKHQAPSSKTNLRAVCLGI